MNEQRIADRVAGEIVGTDRSKSFMGVYKKLEALRQRYEPTSDEAIFLGMVRDMARAVRKGHWSAVKALGMDIQHQLEVDEDLKTSSERTAFSTPDVENAIRDHLSGTSRKTKESLMYNVIRRQLGGIDKRTFRDIWKDLVDEGYLVPVSGGSYKWEM